MRLSDDFISEIKYQNDLSDIASNYIQLKRRGRNLVGLCPFHNEKTPSFNIYSENGSFYCFGCGTGGDVITFVMKIEHLDYMEAIKFLAQRAGIPLPEDDFDDSTSRMRTRIYEANREAARYYYANLYSVQGKNALKYLHDRALTDKTIRHFGLGYSLPSRFELVDYLKEKGFTNSELIAANLAVPTRSGNSVVDRFFDRVMFPIIDLRGNVIAFGGRVMSDIKPKYLNTSDTMVFSKSSNLFSLNNAKNNKDRSLILCEGYMDVIALNQAGFTQAVATLGTALTDEQALLMKRYCDEVIICYDADEAGQKATARAIEILRRAGIVVRVIVVPDGKDPDEFIRKNGDKGTAAFKNILNNSGNDIDYRLFKLSSKYDLKTTSGKLSYLSDAVKVLATVDNAMERDIYCSKLSDQVDVEKNSIKEQIEKELKKRYKSYKKTEFSNIQKSLSAREDRVNTQHSSYIRAAAAEENLIAFLVNNPDKCEFIANRILPADFVTDFNRKLFIYFTERINEGKEPMTAISADFSSEEISQVVRIITSYSTITATTEALEEYINKIKEEALKCSYKDKESVSNDDVDDFLKKMRENRR